jgi:hypothetical protein
MYHHKYFLKFINLRPSSSKTRFQKKVSHINSLFKDLDILKMSKMKNESPNLTRFFQDFLDFNLCC